MRAQFHAAVSALFVAFLIMLIAVVVVQFMAVRAVNPASVAYNPLAAPVWLLQTALTLLALGCAAGIIGWLLAFASGHSGLHRLAAARTWAARR
jgi:hypothetical protein